MKTYKTYKTYKTWEAIKMLTEDSKLKFKTNPTNNDEITQYLYLSDNGFLLVDTDGISDNIDNNIKADDKWILVQEPVSFMEAIEAFHKGKIIYCIIDSEKHVYLPIENEFSELTDGNYNGISIKEILDGKWYIKEDEE